MRHEHPPVAHSSPPHIGTALTLNCGEAKNSARQARHHWPESGQFSDPAGCLLSTLSLSDFTAMEIPAADAERRRATFGWASWPNLSRMGVHPRQGFSSGFVTGYGGFPVTRHTRHRKRFPSSGHM